MGLDLFLPTIKNFFSQIDEPILKFWKKNKIFEKSVESRPKDNSYVFYDGPPFVTGIPHFGHLFVSTLKDVIPRYQTMLGKRVERRWGWDCHGLPIEEKVERKLGTKNRREVEEKVGLERFIKECKAYVNEISDQWEWYIDHIGRWVDMKNPYRTDSLHYMESIIWALKQMYEKGLIYFGKRISLYCPRCGTPVSKFEIQMDNSYKELEDPSVYVKFKAKYTKTGIGVGILIENNKGEVLMFRRTEPGRKEVWGILGGKMDQEDSTILDTVKRELMEEAGVGAKKIEYYGSTVDVFEGRLFHTYHFKVVPDGVPQKSSDETGEFVWVKKEDIPWDDIHIPTKNALQNVLNGKPKATVTPEVTRPNVYLLVWTTTPWTLPENAAIAVNPKETYVTVKYNNEYYILAKARLEEVFKDKDYKVVDEYKGEELVGLSYEPLFDYFKEQASKNDFKVYAADFVTMDDGTGLVHMAPAYGEDDFNLAKNKGISIFEAIDEQGQFTEPVSDFKGIYFKEADPLIIEHLSKNGLLFKAEKVKHSYPVCWRCGTPLLYKAQDSWYVDLQSQKDKMLKLAKQINWVPKTQAKAFENVIKTAPDWGLSRTRFWATPLPFWKCEKCDNMVVVGSIKEIEERSGKKVTDLHRPYIDEHVFTCERCDGKMYRVPDVVDVWFESGSMPFAQFHYPFENKEEFRQNFPADYIVEYIAQVKGWFNVLHRVSSILFDSVAFKNVIAHGVILGTDGRKMSKSFGNYPDPRKTIEKYGADALRLYFTSYSFVESGSEPFNEEFVREQIKEILLPLVNIYKYFAIYANKYGFTYGTNFRPCHVLDRWVLARTNQFVENIRNWLDSYRLPYAAREIRLILDDISAWYIKRSRERFVNGDKDALQTLFRVLHTVVRAVAPFVPFTAEFIYQNYKKILPAPLESVHIELYPEFKNLLPEEERLLQDMQIVRKLASLGHAIRVAQNLPVKQPLYTLVIKDLPGVLRSKDLLELLKDEINVKEVRLLPAKDFDSLSSNFVKEEDDNFAVALDTTIDDTLLEERVVREFIRRIQAIRKEMGLKIGDKVQVKLHISDVKIKEFVERNLEQISKLVEAKAINIGESAPKEGKTFKVLDANVTVLVKAL